MEALAESVAGVAVCRGVRPGVFPPVLGGGAGGFGWGNTARGGGGGRWEAPCWVLKEQPRPPGGGWGCCFGARRGRLLGWLVVGWLWVEMCIVDASILLCVLCWLLWFV